LVFIPEDIVCRHVESPLGFSITVSFRDNPVYNEVIFLDQSDFNGAGTITPKTGSSCVATLSGNSVTFTFGASGAAVCDITTSTGVSYRVKYVVM